MRIGIVLASGGLLALGGCKVGPSYSPPSRAMPEGWSGLEESPAPSRAVAREGDLARWWSVFGDSTLDSLIDRGVANNPDLRIASARVLEARALRGVAGAGQWPGVDLGANATRQRTSGKSGAFPGSGGLEFSNYSVGLDAGWEIDVFGAVARGVEAADADLQAAVEVRRDVLVTLLAEVARNYAELRGFQRRLEVGRRIVEVQVESVSIARSRFDAGLSSELEVVQSQALLETRRAAIPPLEAGERQSSHRLAVLLGQDPATLREELGAPGELPAPPAEIAVGLPSDLLRRRPDIRRAERELAAATARIGVATADLYPRFTLTGSMGASSAQAGDLFDSGSRFWSVGPAVRWNVFDAGRIRGRIDAAGARQQQAMAGYERSILSALEEVENRLVSFSREQERRASLRAALAANERAVSLSDELFRAGVRDFINVLDAQRALYDTQDQLAQSEIAVTTSLVALYKSLGGGWEPPAAPSRDGTAPDAPASEPTTDDLPRN